MARRSKRKRQGGKAAPTQSSSEPEPIDLREEVIGVPPVTECVRPERGAGTRMRWASRAILLLAILIAWGAGAWLRAEWVRNADKPEHADYKWEDGYLLTTHDSFFYASIIEQGTAAQPDHLVQHADYKWQDGYLLTTHDSFFMPPSSSKARPPSRINWCNMPIFIIKACSHCSVPRW